MRMMRGDRVPDEVEEVADVGMGWDGMVGVICNGIVVSPKSVSPKKVLNRLRAYKKQAQMTDHPLTRNNPPIKEHRLRVEGQFHPFALFCCCV